ncbi:MAG: methyl-accepting chemotaxis protein [Roseateles sp.]|uniref:methyl-accepting chemotaxis protein n=1 Tax=Roseateles sp. TaxID=1971397 RepID=UPI0039E9E2A5
MLTTLRSRIVATSLLVVVAAVAASALGAFVAIERDNTRSVGEQLAAVSNAHQLAIDEWLAVKSAAVAGAARHLPLDDPQAALVTLQDSGGFDVAFIGFPDKRHVFSKDIGIPPTFDPTSRGWYKQALAAKAPIITAPYRDAGRNKMLVTFASPILKGGEVVAVVAASVLMDGVNTNVVAIRPTPASLGFLVSADGKFVAHPDAERALKPVIDTAPTLDAARLQALAADGSVAEADVDGVPKRVRVSKVAQAGWFLVVALDRRESVAGLRNVLWTSLAVFGVVVLLAGAVMGVVTGRAFAKLSAVRDALADVASGDGDLSKRLPAAGRDEVAQIAQSFNAFVEKMSGVLGGIRETSASVRTASDEIALGNQELSSRTEHTASSLQRAAASLEELTATLSHSADAAGEASRMAAAAADGAAQGGRVVAGVVTTMDEIRDASRRIADITSVIDGIAFQTNILALNAAVEAARAGEQGRGFAVVAGEVRTLAQRAGQAAREIKALVGTSEARVEAGATLVSQAGATMTDLVGSVQRVAARIQEITVAAAEQSAGLSQVNVAVNQLDEATQQNAALVEESAAAAESLKDQAAALAAAAASFRLAGR